MTALAAAAPLFLVVAAACPPFPRSRPSMASAASAVVGAALPPARVPVLAASWPPRVLALERAVVSSLPRAPALAVALMPRVLAQPLVVVSTLALVLQGP